MNADKKKIWCNGQLIEVSDKVYTAYMKGDRKIRYFENDLKTERFLLNENGTIKQIVPSREDSLDRLMEDNARQFSDCAESPEEAVFRSLSYKKLHEALALLTEEEQELIIALFFDGQTERDVATALGVSQPAIHKRKNKILAKLKLFLES